MMIKKKGAPTQDDDNAGGFIRWLSKLTLSIIVVFVVEMHTNIGDWTLATPRT